MIKIIILGVKENKNIGNDQLVAALYLNYKYIFPRYSITGNIVQGSAGNGFILSGSSCGGRSGFTSLFKYNKLKVFIVFNLLI
jgi:hypothetical protein